jgi:alkylation response protein AidB-like acyl-CoA dehydrogenase
LDFELTGQQKQIRLTAREFAEGELVPLGKECEQKGDFPREIIKKAAHLGFKGTKEIQKMAIGRRILGTG